MENWGKGLERKSVNYYGQRLSIYECVYRNMHWVKYLVYTDLDEFIVPRKSIGWADMMKQMENEKYASYMFRNTFFFESENNTGKHLAKMKVRLPSNGTCEIEMPKFLTYLFRSTKIWDVARRSKYIVKPVCLQSSHMLVHQVKHRGRLARYVVPPDYALMNHYRIFRKGILPVEENANGHQHIPDKDTLVYEEKIVAALNTRFCGRGANLP